MSDLKDRSDWTSLDGDATNNTPRASLSKPAVGLVVPDASKPVHDPVFQKFMDELDRMGSEIVREVEESLDEDHAVFRAFFPKKRAAGRPAKSRSSSIDTTIARQSVERAIELLGVGDMPNALAQLDLALRALGGGR